jgi:hypothetical protein
VNVSSRANTTLSCAALGTVSGFTHHTPNTLYNLFASVLIFLTIQFSDEIEIASDTQWRFALASPIWFFLRLTIPSFKILSMVALQTQETEVVTRLAMRLARDSYPNLHTARECEISFSSHL